MLRCSVCGVTRPDWRRLRGHFGRHLAQHNRIRRWITTSTPMKEVLAAARDGGVHADRDNL